MALNIHLLFKLVAACAPLALIGALCCPADWPEQPILDPLPADIAFVLHHTVELDVRGIQESLDELPPDSAGDPLEELDGCWGSYEQTVCGVDCFYDCQLIHAYRFDKESGRIERQYYKPETSYLTIHSGSYAVASADRITLHYETETYYSDLDQAFITKTWPFGPVDGSFTLRGDVLIECPEGCDYPGMLFRQFKCP